MAHQTQAQTSITEPTNKSVAKAKELRSALKSGRAEAKPGAKLLDLGRPLRFGEIAGPRLIRRLEIQDTNEAIKKSLRQSKGRRAKARSKPRKATRSGGR